MAMMRISVRNSSRRITVTEEAQEACGYGNATSTLHTSICAGDFPDCRNFVLQYLKPWGVSVMLAGLWPTM